MGAPQRVVVGNAIRFRFSALIIKCTNAPTNFDNAAVTEVAGSGPNGVSNTASRHVAGVVRQITAVPWNEELGAKSDAGRQLRFLP